MNLWGVEVLFDDSTEIVDEECEIPFVTVKILDLRATSSEEHEQDLCRDSSRSGNLKLRTYLNFVIWQSSVRLAFCRLSTLAMPRPRAMTLERGYFVTVGTQLNCHR